MAVLFLLRFPILRNVNRPKIVIHIAQTVDARISLRRGISRWEEVLASKAPKATPLWASILREEIRPDLLLAGSETFLVGRRARPSFPSGKKDRRDTKDFLPQQVVDAVREKKTWSGWQAVVDSRGNVPWGTRERTFWGKSWHPLVLVSHRTPSGYLSMLRRKMIPYLISGSDEVNLSQSLTKLSTELGIGCVASLGGGRLNGALLRAGLFDEISIVLVPMIVGGEKTPASFVASELGFKEMPTFLRTLSSKVEEDGSIRLRYGPKT